MINIAKYYGDVRIMSGYAMSKPFTAHIGYMQTKFIIILINQLRGFNQTR